MQVAVLFLFTLCFDRVGYLCLIEKVLQLDEVLPIRECSLIVLFHLFVFVVVVLKCLEAVSHILTEEVGLGGETFRARCVLGAGAKFIF